MSTMTARPPVQCPEKSKIKPGDVFGKLTVETFYGTAKNGDGYCWMCRCSCGETFILSTKRINRLRGECLCVQRFPSIPEHERVQGESLDAAIRRLWPKYTQPAIGKYLGLSKDIVRKRVASLGLALRGDMRRDLRNGLDPHALGRLDLAPGHVASDKRSYELIVAAKASRRGRLAKQEDTTV